MRLPCKGTIDVWRNKEKYYTERLQNLIKKFPEEFTDDYKTYPNGLAHDIQEFRREWYDKAKNDKMLNVAIYFIKINGHLSLAFTDARIKISELIKDYTVYDFGQGCCPPQ